MRLDRRWIEQHIPQQGSMCLLDEVLSWDREHALCRSAAHLRGDHPLRAHGRLGSAHAIEYAAQAAAVHGALLLREPASSSARGEQLREVSPASRFGMLASARAVELLAVQLDGARGDLLVRVTCQHADSDSALYEFMVSEQPRGNTTTAAATIPLARGRLGLWLNAAAARIQMP